jgi:histidinol dehydrogenase
VDDFIKKSQFTYYTKNALSAVAEKVALFAQTEGLTAHAKSAVIRMEEDK